MEFLTKYQETAINVLAQSELKNKFYWTGGTLLAFYYLKHRTSVDLDFFSGEEFSLEELQLWLDEFSQKSGLSLVSSQKIFDRREFLFQGKNKNDFLRVEFVYYNHNRKTLGERKDFMGVKIDSLEDIAANKTMSFFDRNEPKDLFDIYFLIEKGKFSPEKLLSLMKEKFGVGFSVASFWSESFRKIPLLSNIKPMLAGEHEEKVLEELTEFFQKESRKYLDQVIA